MRLVEGRDFTWDDNDKNLAAVIINETVARDMWPGQDAMGKIANVNGSDARVIGVVADVHETSAETAAGWQMYVSQMPRNRNSDLSARISSSAPSCRPLRLPLR